MSKIEVTSEENRFKDFVGKANCLRDAEIVIVISKDFNGTGFIDSRLDDDNTLIVLQNAIDRIKFEKKLHG